MTAPKHTPGPWSFQGAATRWITAPSETGMPWYVAEVIGGCDHDGSGVDRQDANAHLIAAAPELYEALNLLLYRACKELADPEDCEEIQRAERAISKSRGESNG